MRAWTLRQERRWRPGEAPDLHVTRRSDRKSASRLLLRGLRSSLRCSLRLLASDGVVQLFAGSELDTFARGDVDLLARLRIHTHAGGSVAYAEHAETDEPYRLTRFERLADRLEGRVHEARGLLDALALFLRDRLDQILTTYWH